MKGFLLVLSFGAFLILSSCANVRIKEREDWNQYFETHQIKGCFEIYDNNKEIASYSNKERCSEQVSPLSTFMIFSSLVGLESSIAPTEQLSIPWDGEKRAPDEWNQDLTMTEAFKFSSVPYFQELNRRIGKPTMQKYIDSARYGNREIGASIESFWRDGTLKISNDEQVGLMKRLYHGELSGFSERSQRIVRGMMFQSEGKNYRMYYKSDFDTFSDNKQSWLIGFVEVFVATKNPKTKEVNQIPHPYFFAINIDVRDNAEDYLPVKLDVLHKVLKDMNVILVD